VKWRGEEEEPAEASKEGMVTQNPGKLCGCLVSPLLQTNNAVCLLNVSSTTRLAVLSACSCTCIGLCCNHAN
jgi:hypothetical protein